MTSFRPVLQRRMRLSGFSIMEIGCGGQCSRGSSFPSPDWIGLSHVRKGYAYNRISPHVNTVKPGELYYHTEAMYWTIHGSFLCPQECGYFWISAHGNRVKAGELYYHNEPIYKAVSQPRQYLQPHAYDLNRSMHITGFQLTSKGQSRESNITRHSTDI